MKLVGQWLELGPCSVFRLSCFMMLHPFVATNPWTWIPPSTQTASTSLPGCLLPLLVINNTAAAPLPPVSPPLPPCLLHTGTLPFGETDWLWWGRRWGSCRGYSCAQGSLLHLPGCRISLLSLTLPRAVAGETGDWHNLKICMDTLNRLSFWPCRKLRRTPCVPVWLIYLKPVSHVI